MPDDCGLKPPIDTLPQIAQERAMVVLETVVAWVIMFGPGRKRAGMLGWKARAGRYDSTRVARHARAGPADPNIEGDARGVPTRPSIPTPGRSLVTRRAVVDIVRAATLGSYGVVGLAGGGPAARLAEWLGLAPRGIRVGLEKQLTIDLDLVVGHGLPIAEVARQVDSAIRYAIRQSLGREVERLTIHVDGLRVAGFEPVVRSSRAAGSAPVIAPDDLAASGTDVA
jgi:uncharacterized alkaline shock family protein YloU